MAFRFEFQETFLKAIPRIARERIDHVIESLSEKPRPGAEAVHEARKNLKSLRALLRLARGSIDNEVRIRENLLFREAGRMLSTIRDPQALLESLGHFAKPHRRSSELSTRKRELIRTFIGQIRRKIESKLVGGLPPEAVEKLVKDLREARRRAAFWFDNVILAPGDEWPAFVGAGLKKTYQKGKNLVWQFEVIGHDAGSTEAWHELRKCAKALGYQLRLLKPIWPGTMATLMDEIDQMTDRLGDANDLSILRARILDEPYDPLETRQTGETRRVFLQTLDRRKQRLHSEAFALARLIYAEKPGQFERRLAGYWQIWRGQGKAKDPPVSRRNGRRLDRQDSTDQKAVSVNLASSPP